MVEKLYPYAVTDQKTVEIFLSDDNCTVGHVILQPGDELEEHSTDSNVYLLLTRGEITLSLNKAETKTFGTGAVVNVPYRYSYGHEKHLGKCNGTFCIQITCS